MWDPLRPKYPKKVQKKQTSGEAKKTHSKKARQGHTKYVCEISGYISQKTAWTLDLKEIGVIFFNQLVFLLRLWFEDTPHAAQLQITNNGRDVVQ